MIDIVWISLAFLLGLGATRIGLPPLAGYLGAGFALYALGVDARDSLAQFSELGITLLLFTIGLKLNLKVLLRPQVWAVATAHVAMITLVFTALLPMAGVLGLTLLSDLGWRESMIVGFALSFSSTVFAVKFLEERGDMKSVYGRTMIGILIVQDIAAVVFLAATAGKVPSLWALLLLPALWPMGWLMGRLLDRVGHGELLVLFGLTLAVGGAFLFNVFNVKGDLGALILGVLLARHRNAPELAKALLSLKDLFLVGFFLSVGLAGTPSPGELLVAALLLLVVPIKSALFFWMLTRSRMRARSSLLTSLGLSNYSEFGLIVIAVAVSDNMLPDVWLTTVAVTLAMSMVAASPINRHAFALYERYRERLQRFQHPTRLPEEAGIDPGPAGALVFGMGRIGSGAYDKLQSLGHGPVVGIDSSLEAVTRHMREGRLVIRASGTDPDFWSVLKLDFNRLVIVILAMPRVEENAMAARELRSHGFQGQISAAVRHRDQKSVLIEAGVDHAVDLFEEAGAGLAEDANRGLKADPAAA